MKNRFSIYAAVCLNEKDEDFYLKSVYERLKVNPEISVSGSYRNLIRILAQEVHEKYPDVSIKISWCSLDDEGDFQPSEPHIHATSSTVSDYFGDRFSWYLLNDTSWHVRTAFHFKVAKSQIEAQFAVQLHEKLQTIFSTGREISVDPNPDKYDPQWSYRIRAQKITELMNQRVPHAEISITMGTDEELQGEPYSVICTDEFVGDAYVQAVDEVDKYPEMWLVSKTISVNIKGLPELPEIELPEMKA